VNNYADVEHYLRVVVVGYPISGIEKIRVRCEDRITLDGTLSAIDTYGDRSKVIDNPFVQSPSLARVLGFSLLDWLKYEHSRVATQVRFNDRLGILEPCLVRAAGGNFDEESELWLCHGITYSLVRGTSGMSSVTYMLADMEESPSLPAPASS